MATDRAAQFWGRVEPLGDRNYTKFRDLLSEEPPRLPPGQLSELRQLLDRDQRKLEISADRRKKIEQIVARYVKGAKSVDIGVEVQLVMTRVLMHRYAIRIVG